MSRFSDLGHILGRRAVLTLCIGALAGTAPAFAGESLFSRVYTTETVPAGRWELTQLVRVRAVRSFGSYSAEDFKTGAEYGLTDSLQGTLYLNSGRVDAFGAPDDKDPNGATGFTRQQPYFQGVSAELVYRALSPARDPIGLAFAYAPGFEVQDPRQGLSWRNVSNEYRLLFQKDFLEDQLILVYNAVAVVSFFRYVGDADVSGPNWQGALEWNNELGLTDRFASNWYGGWELRNHNKYSDFHAYAHSVYWTGPVLHYGGRRVWGTLGVLRQFYGDPNGTDSKGTFIGDGLFLRSNEAWETTMKLGLPF
jgi:hypothetical protein